MIKSFNCKEAENIWEGTLSRRLPHDIQAIARRKLRMINNAQTINDLRIPPANRLEGLVGKRKDQHSIRINKQWRICFIWKNGDAYSVEIIDYHS
ncbi:MAG: type II toxin-antitoxin system RelE/ParE family toxin [Sedimenticola sp.]